MSRLYDISERYNNIMDLVENPDLDFELIKEALNEVQDEFSEKADNIARFIKELTLTAAMIKEEENRLAARRKSFENRANSLKDYLEDNMKVTNQKKLKTSYFTFNIQNNPPSIIVVDESLIPEELKSTEIITKVDKKSILKLLKDDIEVKGIELKQTESLRIR